jgi:hypothetical protein
VIVVVGSRHDRVAGHLVATWPRAALCSAEDLLTPGWVWPSSGAADRTWVVDGACVPDSEVTGVFVRRATVYPDELLQVHPDDRPYLAAECHAFLIFVLATTGASVANPVGDGAIGDEAVRLERWMPAAIECGLTLAPLRLTSTPRRARTLTTHVVEVVGTESFGDASFGDAASRCRRGAVQLVGALGMRWAACVFDGRRRLAAVTTAAVPSNAAAEALARVLGGDPT